MITNPCGRVLDFSLHNQRVRCGDTIDDVTYYCIFCRITALEADSHPPMPSLDADDFDRWRKEHERKTNSELKQLRSRIIALEAAAGLR